MSGWFLAAYVVVWAAIIGFVLWLDWRQWQGERERDAYARFMRGRS